MMTISDDIYGKYLFDFQITFLIYHKKIRMSIDFYVHFTHLTCDTTPSLSYFIASEKHKKDICFTDVLFMFFSNHLYYLESASSFMLSAILFFSASTSKTRTFTISPTFTMSDGCLTNLSAMFEIWTRPS